LPFGTFALVMQPIHLAIGAVEGLITAALLVFLHRVQPEAVTGLNAARAGAGLPKKAIAIVAALALVCAGALSWFASTHPDGLEWSIFKTTGMEELTAPAGIHRSLDEVQQATAFLPDYGLKAAAQQGEPEQAEEAAWPAVDAGTSLAGVLGSVITLALAGLVGLLLYLPRRRKRQAAA
jgi:cobalt/nickel transport system permease protein